MSHSTLYIRYIYSMYVYGHRYCTPHTCDQNITNRPLKWRWFGDPTLVLCHPRVPPLGSPSGLCCTYMQSACGHEPLSICQTLAGWHCAAFQTLRLAIQVCNTNHWQSTDEAGSKFTRVRVHKPSRGRWCMWSHDTHGCGSLDCIIARLL